MTAPAQRRGPHLVVGASSLCGGLGAGLGAFDVLGVYPLHTILCTPARHPQQHLHDPVTVPGPVMTLYGPPTASLAGKAPRPRVALGPVLVVGFVARVV